MVTSETFKTQTIYTIMQTLIVYGCIWILSLRSSNLLVNANPAPNIPSKEKEPQFWNDIAQDYITKRLAWKENNRIAKNVILFIGDGMGGTTITAARILKGQLNGQPGEETVLKFEEFPNVALSKTYNVDRQTPDSAGTATAMLSGTKTNYFTIGLNPKAKSGDCESSKGNHVTTMLNWAQDAGKSTGVVTTARITHATPASAFAHSADRYWEGDVNTKAANVDCKDIAAQLIDDNKDINVLFGGGRRVFLPNTTRDPEYNDINSNQRQDGRDLIQEWKDNMESAGRRHKYVWNNNGFDSIDPEFTDYTLGLFEPNHMQYELDRNKSGEKGEPSLAEMTSKALRILRRNPLGYFALIEGARIDHGHHDSLAKKALHETLEFEEAIRVALDLVDLDDTLVIVTADHSIVFDIAGYAYRGTDVFGLVEPVDPSEYPTDKMPYSVLVYGNGPGYTEPRKNLTEEDLHDKNYAYPSAVPIEWTAHGGEDTMAYADGPMAHLLHGVHEQNYIAHVMAYSACIGPYQGQCPRPQNNDETSSATSLQSALTLVFLVTLNYLFF